MSELDIVGKSYPQIDGMAKAMGKTKFVTDMVLPGMLYAAQWLGAASDPSFHMYFTCYVDP